MKNPSRARDRDRKTLGREMSLLIPSAVVRHRTCILPETLVRSRPFPPNRNGNGKGNVFLSFCRGQGLGREISRIACSDRSDDSVSEKVRSLSYHEGPFSQRPDCSFGGTRDKQTCLIVFVVLI